MALTQDRALLAVSRENNSLEIWKADSFTQILNIPGHRNLDIRNLHWLEPENTKGSNQNVLTYTRLKNGKTIKNVPRRLISTGLNGLITEWDLTQNKPKSKYNCHCAIWDSVLSGKFIYVACEDGSIRVLKIKKNKIELIKMLVKSSSSCLSIAVVEEMKKEKTKKTKRSKTNSDDESDDQSSDADDLMGPVYHVFAGYADGTLKKWEVRTGNCLLQIDKYTKKQVG